MPLTVNVYHISCDTKGCDAVSAGTLEQLNRDGWRNKVYRQGKGCIEELAPYGNNFACMCQLCVKEAASANA
jgi:hypothetical protein